MRRGHRHARVDQVGDELQVGLDLPERPGRLLSRMPVRRRSPGRGCGSMTPRCVPYRPRRDRSCPGGRPLRAVGPCRASGRSAASGHVLAHRRLLQDGPAAVRCLDRVEDVRSVLGRVSFGKDRPGAGNSAATAAISTIWGACRAPGREFARGRDSARRASCAGRPPISGRSASPAPSQREHRAPGRP